MRGDLTARIREVIEVFGPELDGLGVDAFERSRIVRESDTEDEEERVEGPSGFGGLLEGMFSIDLGWESEDLDGGIGYE
jgi:hypothetical protein